MTTEAAATIRTARAAASGAVIVGALGHGALLASWLGVSAGALAWLGRSWADPARRTNLVLFLTLAAVVAALGATKLPRAWKQAAPDSAAPPRPRPAALLLLAACAIGQWYRPRSFDLQTLRAVFFVMGCWALAGLYLAPARWRRALPLALAAAALLPFGDHLDAFLGVPARIATARVAQALLVPLGIPVQSSAAVLVLESGIADIDLPCSGVKGLWVGTIFFLALTWIDRRAIGGRWLLAAAVYATALLGTNLARVMALVMLTFVAGSPDAAALLHLPLGVAGFAAASLLGVLALRRLVPADGGLNDVQTRTTTTPRAAIRAWLAGAALAGSLAVLALLDAVTPAPASAGAGPLRDISLEGLGARVTLDPVPLNSAEQALFSRHGARGANKWRFRAGSGPNAPAGALLVVVADSYVAHHAPEVCLAGAGRRVDGVFPSEVRAGFPVRVVSLDRGQARAFYWFQSRSGTTTAALLDRTLAEVTGRERRWALVSILFEGPAAASDAAVWPLLADVHAAVAGSLARSNPAAPPGDSP